MDRKPVRLYESPSHLGLLANPHTAMFLGGERKAVETLGHKEKMQRISAEMRSVEVGLEPEDLKAELHTAAHCWHLFTKIRLFC